MTAEVIPLRPRFRCPGCHSSEGLWEEIEARGWRPVDETLLESGPIEYESPLRVWETATYGCSRCDWEGGKKQLERLGTDGEPLPVIHPNQLSIADVGILLSA